MVIVLPGYLAVAPAPGAVTIPNPFPVGSQLYLIWSSMWDAARPWTRGWFAWSQAA